MASEMAPFRLEFGSPYREHATGRYVFADVEGPSRFLEWRRIARDRLSPLLVDLARTSDEPHLTIAVAESGHDEIDEFLEGLPSLPSCRVMRVDIAESGSQGRRLDVLRTVLLERERADG